MVADIMFNCMTEVFRSLDGIRLVHSHVNIFCVCGNYYLYYSVIISNCTAFCCRENMVITMERFKIVIQLQAIKKTKKCL